MEGSGEREGRSARGGGRRGALLNTPPHTPSPGGSGTGSVGTRIACRSPLPACPALPERGALSGHRRVLLLLLHPGSCRPPARRGEGLRAARGSVSGGVGRLGATRGSPPPGPNPGRCRHFGCAAGLRLEGDGGYCSAHRGRTAEGARPRGQLCALGAVPAAMAIGGEPRAPGPA